MHIKIGFVLYMKIPEKPLINMAVELMGQGSSESGWSRILIIRYTTPHHERSNTVIFRSIAHKTQITSEILSGNQRTGEIVPSPKTLLTDCSSNKLENKPRGTYVTVFNNFLTVIMLKKSLDSE